MIAQERKGKHIAERERRNSEKQQCEQGQKAVEEVLQTLEEIPVQPMESPQSTGQSMRRRYRQKQTCKMTISRHSQMFLGAGNSGGTKE